MIQLVERSSKKELTERIYGEKWLKRGQSPLLDPFVNNSLIQRAVSVCYGAFQKTPFSSNKVQKFCGKYNIDLNDFVVPDKHSFDSFNQFFIRRYKEHKRSFPQAEKIFAACAEGRLSAFRLGSPESPSPLLVKGAAVEWPKLLGALSDHAALFAGGSALVFRLCPSDYHRFHFPDSGALLEHSSERGKLYSVNPITLEKRPQVFLQNKRHVSILDTKNFGKIAYIEVGAYCVGSIKQSFEPKEAFFRGQEKGYFEFGGSTVVLLCQKQLKIDSDLLQNTGEGKETLVQLGEKIAEST